MGKTTSSEKKLLKNLGKRIRTLRKQKGFSSHETFAYQNDISRGLYGKYERGENDLQFLSLVRVLQGLDTSLKDFFAEGFEDIESSKENT